MFSDCLGGLWTGDEGLNVGFKHLYTNIASITVVRLLYTDNSLYTTVIFLSQ